MAVEDDNKKPSSPSNPAMAEALRQASQDAVSRGQRPADAGLVGGSQDAEKPTVAQRVQHNQAQPKVTNPAKKANVTMNNQPLVYTLDDAENGINRTLGLSSTAVDVNAFKKQIETMMETDPSFSVTAYGKPTLVTVEASQTGMPCNALVIVQHGQENGVRVPVFYTLLMEPSEPLPSRLVQLNQYTVELKTVAGDIYSADVAKLIAAQVAGLSGAEVSPQDAGYRVIPANLDIKDPENLKYTRAVMYFVFAALNTCIDVQFGGARYLSLPDSGQQQISATTNFSGQQLETAVGSKVRADVLLTTIRRKQAVGITNLPGQARPLTTLAGFMDLFYGPARPVQSQQTYVSTYNLPNTSKSMYLPRFVITRCQPMSKVISLGEMLLALSTATLMGKDHNWTRAFLPKRGVADDMHDIGGLGYEHEFVDGKLGKIDTQAPDFRLNELLDQCVYDTLFYSMDIEEAGDLTWVESILIDAARGDSNAIAALWDAADALTGNRFSMLMPNDQPLVSDDIVRVHLGHYQDNDKLRDLRDIGHLELLNLSGKSGPGLANKWSNALVDFTRTPAESLVDRQNILQEILGPSMVITGYANRITFNSVFLISLANAVRDSGTTITYDGENANQNVDPRVSTQYLQFGQQANTQTTQFSSGYNQNFRANQPGVRSPVSGNIFQRGGN